MQWIIAGLVFVSIALVAGTVLTLFFSEERQVRRALRNVSEWEGQQATAAEPLLRPFRSRVLSPVMSGALSTLTAAMPQNARERMQHTLDLAGNPRQLEPEGVVGLRMACGSAGLVVSFLLVARPASSSR